MDTPQDCDPALRSFAERAAFFGGIGGKASELKITADVCDARASALKGNDNEDRARHPDVVALEEAAARRRTRPDRVRKAPRARVQRDFSWVTPDMDTDAICDALLAESSGSSCGSGTDSDAEFYGSKLLYMYLRLRSLGSMGLKMYSFKATAGSICGPGRAADVSPTAADHSEEQQGVFGDPSVVGNRSSGHVPPPQSPANKPFGNAAAQDMFGCGPKRVVHSYLTRSSSMRRRGARPTVNPYHGVDLLSSVYIGLDIGKRRLKTGPDPWPTVADRCRFRFGGDTSSGDDF